jgi:seryl-tRNA synthetase
MHDIKYFESNTSDVKNNLSKRGFDLTQIDKVISLNGKRKELTGKVETLRAEVKNLSQQIGKLKKEGKDASEIMNSVSEIKKEIETGEASLGDVEKELNYNLSIIPNLVSDDVRPGNPRPIMWR